MRGNGTHGANNLFGSPFRERSTWNRRLTLLVGSLATIPWESQNLLRTKSRSASTASLRDNFSRAVTLNARIPRLWMEFQVSAEFSKEPEDPLKRRRRVVCRFRLPAGSFNFVFLPAFYFASPSRLANEKMSTSSRRLRWYLRLVNNAHEVTYNWLITQAII